MLSASALTRTISCRWSGLQGGGSTFTALRQFFSSQPCEHSTLPVLTFFTKRNEPCSLCDQAKETLDKYRTRFIYEEVYIDDPANVEWYGRYRFDIPVIHLNHQFLMKHRVDEELLEKALKRS